MKLKLPQKNPQKQGRILEGGGIFWLARIYIPEGTSAGDMTTNSILQVLPSNTTV